ncbi:VOC family protein [Aurantiacibacter sediminis]|uniref:VOC family protein n=1 Tax=Aurantiacibacter sediminis TaxID=2793064 RepID=A0ABS0N036_9SPHN|nr:VOC family protein [Aurantiacibacter sediminis]MBH5321324.1 VOC family protein [Aurantiacibacter sediminis]
MKRRISLTAILVDEYDRALDFFVGKLGFEIVQDKRLSEEKRWVVITPSKGEGGLLLARASDDEQRKAVGNQSGGRVFLFLETDNFDRDHAEFSSRGVHFVEEPRREEYGKVAVFEDLYGNRWDLIESPTS